MALVMLSGCHQDSKSYTNTEAIAFKDKLKRDVAEISFMTLNHEKKYLLINLFNQKGEKLYRLLYEMTEGTLEAQGQYFMERKESEEFYIFDAVYYNNIAKNEVETIRKGIDVNSNVINNDIAVCTMKKGSNDKGERINEDNCSDDQKKTIEQAIAEKDKIFKELDISDEDIWKYLEWCAKNNVDEVKSNDEDAK